MARLIIARWNLKEAYGKILPQGTRTASGMTGGMRLLNKSKSKNYEDTGVYMRRNEASDDYRYSVTFEPEGMTIVYKYSGLNNVLQKSLFINTGKFVCLSRYYCVYT